METRLGNYIHEYSVRNKLDEDIPVYSVTNSQGFCKDYFGKEVASKNKTTYKIVPKGYFAYNPSRINVGSVDWQRNEERVIVSPLYNVFYVDSEINHQYLFYFLKSNFALQNIKAVATGSVRDNLKFEMLKEFQIKLLPLEEQNEIVEKLDLITKIIEEYKAELYKYDELIKARFIEMFGDPITNTKKFPTKRVIDVVTLQRGYDLPNKERRKDGIIPLYGANGQFDWHDTSKACHGIITGRSGSIGQVYYCETEFWPLNTTLFSVDNHGNNIIYLSYLLDFFDLKRFSNGTGVPTLNRNLIHKENIIDVPLISQNQFADFVQQVDKSRFDIKKSITEIEREVVYD